MIQPLDQENFTAMDLETTGGRPESNGILEIGLAKIRSGKITDLFSSLVNTDYPIPPIVKRMTGISPEMIEEAPAFQKIAPKILDFIDCDIVISHGIPFDVQFLNFHLEKIKKTRLTNPSLCTVQLGERLLPESPSRRLNKLAEYLGISPEAHHRAWSDAETTAKIFIATLEILKKMNICTFFQLYRFLKK